MLRTPFHGYAMFVAIAMTYDLISAVAESYLLVLGSAVVSLVHLTVSSTSIGPFSFLSHLYGHSGTFCL